jgi:hypothetical protein
MARVVRVPDGYEFIGLRLTGMRLVNEFQRRFPRMCAPSREPDLRLIRQGSSAKNLELAKLITNVLRLDPESRPKSEWSRRG